METETLHPAARGLHERTPADLARLAAAEARAVAAAVDGAAPDIARAIEMAETALSRGGRLILVGAGTSGRLAAMQAAEVPPTFGLPPGRVVAVVAGGARALRRAVEGREDDAAAGARAVRRLGVGPADLVFGVTASGRTPFVLGALDASLRAGSGTVVVTSGSPPDRAAGISVHLATGPELVAGSTRLKAATAAKIVLDAVTTGAFARLGRVEDGWMVGVRATNRKLHARAIRIIEALSGAGAEKAAHLLDAAGGATDLALVMARTGAPVREARALLDAASGDVPRASRAGRRPRAKRRR